MDPSLTAIVVVTAAVAATMVAALAYLLEVRVQRAPVGVYNVRDIVVMSVVLVVLPPLYTHLPAAVVATVLAGMAAFVCQFTLSPMIGGRPALAVALAVVAVDVALAQLHDEAGHQLAFLAVNNVVMVVVVVGVTNLYVQSGMRARQVAAFAGGLVVYDFLATVAFPVMVEFFTRVASLPGTPAMGWGRGAEGLGIGLGDVLVATLWVLVVEKAWGRGPALVAAVSGVGAASGVFAAFWFDWVDTAVPVMVVLGPVIVAEHWAFRRRYGRERTAAEFLAEVDGTPLPPRVSPAWPPAGLEAAMALAGTDGATGGRYVALVDGEPVAEAPDAGTARRLALRARPGAVPLLVWTTAPSSPSTGGVALPVP